MAGKSILPNSNDAENRIATTGVDTKPTSVKMFLFTRNIQVLF